MQLTTYPDVGSEKTSSVQLFSNKMATASLRFLGICEEDLGRGLND